MILKNPFNLQEREIKHIDIKDEQPLKTYLEEHAPISSTMEYHASINGRVYKPEEIETQIVRDGDSVVVCPVIRGGGGGSNPLAILAGIALAVFSFGVVSPFVSGLFGGGLLGSIAGSLAGGLTMMIGGQLISNAFSPSIQANNSEVQKTSYGWGALQPITQQGAIIPMTYGTVRTAGQILNQHITVDETDDDTQYLELLLCGGEGPLDSISDIKINDNPIDNFENTTYYTRMGENTQSLIEGFERLYSSQSVGVILNPPDEITHGDSSDDTIAGEGVVYAADDAPADGAAYEGPGEWSVVEINGDLVDDIEVCLDFPEGLGWIDDDGNVLGNRLACEFEISWQNDSGIWGNWYGNAIIFDSTEKKSKLTPFSKVCSLKSHIADFPYQLQTKFRVRARWTASLDRDPKALQYRGKVQWSSVVAVVNSKMTHPNKALLAVKVKATDQLNGGMPTITWKQTRSQVIVRNLTGTGWEYADAQNPAWIIYDLIVHARDLDGTIQIFGENPSRIDMSAFMAWASWNARDLRNRPAMKMNLLIDESKSLWEWCNDIAGSARGAIVLKGTKISCIFDRPSTPVQMFTMGNIISGSFSGEFLPIEERANAVEIAFNNENNNYEREQITVYAEGYNDVDSRANPVSIQLTGITDFERAYREGIYRLNQNKYILRTITFSADVDAIACQVGDVILVQHDIPQWGQGGRILSVNGLELTLDKEVTFNPSYSYVILIRKQDDVRVQYVVSGSGTTNSVTVQGVTASALAGISPFDVFSFGQIDKTAKPFRVQEMTRTGDLQVTLTCTEYIAELYTEAENIPVIDYTEHTNAVTSLQIISTGYYSNSGQWQPEIWAFWQYIGERPASYQVQWKYDNGTWGGTVNVSDTRAQCAIRGKDTLYHVRVRALYVSGLPSDWSYATGTALVFSPTIPPNAPTNLEALGWFGYASLTWNNPRNVDFSHVEVWEGTEDDLTNAVHIGNTPADSYTRLLPAGGAFWYWVRAVNLTGLKSAFNSLAGTPCVVSAESHEAYVTQLLEDNPYLAESLGRLAERIEPLEDSVEEIPALAGQIIDNQSNIQQILFPALDRISSGVLRLSDETARTREVFRWAGFEVNEEEGYVVIRALEDIKTKTGYQFSDVEERLDAHEADITLKASRVYVDELAASIISGIVVAQEWKFSRTLNGWTGQNATLTAQPDGMKYVITSANPSMTSPYMSIDGSVNNIVAMQLKQLSGNSPFSVRIQYQTSAHGYSDAYMNRIDILGNMTVIRSLQVNMHSLTTGGNDWKNSIITGIRILITDAVGAEYLVPLVKIGRSSASDLTLEGLTMRITQAEIDIDGANAAIKLKADETTVTALGQRLSQAEVDIDAANSRIDLKADITSLGQTNARLQSAELSIDALKGTVSQSVYDFQILGDNAHALSDTAIQNAINHSDGLDRSRFALAQAKQELQAKITETNEAVATSRLQLTAMIGDNSAKIAEEATARANGDRSTASMVSTLQSTVSGHTASIQTNAQAISSLEAGLAARYTLKTDINGYVSGYELYNGGEGMSSFVLAADKFLISRPGVKDPKQLFVYDSTTGTLVLDNLTVTNARIANAAITTAKVADLAVNTAKIADYAVSEMASTASSGAITLVTSEFRQIAYLSLKTLADTPVVLHAQIDHTTTRSSDFVLILMIGKGLTYSEANSNQLVRREFSIPQKYSGNAGLNLTGIGAYSAAGTYTYSLWGQLYDTKSTAVSSCDVYTTRLVAYTLKK